MTNQQPQNPVLSWKQQNDYLVRRGISESVWNVLCNTLYPSNKPESVILAWDYCEARNLDIMMKPIHLVPMSVKNPQNNQYEMRDIPMPGVGLYRIQASRSGDYAGSDEPEFGPLTTVEFTDKYKGTFSLTYPEWCKHTVYKSIGSRLVSFSAKEYWIENYATAGRDTDCPNAMWKKRVFGQLAKCTEVQALRKAWPEIGQEVTAHELEGKAYFLNGVDEKYVTNVPSVPPVPPVIPDDDVKKEGSKTITLNEIYRRGIQAIETGKKTPEEVVDYINKKGLHLSSSEEAALHQIGVYHD